MKCVIKLQKTREKRMMSARKSAFSNREEFNEQVKWQEMKCFKLIEERHVSHDIVNLQLRSTKKK